MANTNNTVWQKFIDFCNDIPKIEKDGTNPHFKSKYTTLDEIFNKLKEPMRKHEVRVYHNVSSEVLENNWLLIKVTPVFCCKTGDTIEGESFQCLAIANQIQNNGSIITYAKRYTISAFLGISADEDDDGNSGMETTKAANTSALTSKLQAKVIAPNDALEPYKNMIRTMTRENANDVMDKVITLNNTTITKGFNKQLKALGLMIANNGIEPIPQTDKE